MKVYVNQKIVFLRNTPEYHYIKVLLVENNYSKEYLETIINIEIRDVTDFLDYHYVGSFYITIEDD